MDTAFVRPRRDDDGVPVLVRQPERSFAPLPDEGAIVPLDDYWHRRLRDGDVVEADPLALPVEVAPVSEVEPVSDDAAEPASAPAAEAAPSTTEEA